MVPALTGFLALYGLLFDPSNVATQTAALSGWLPAEALTLIDEQLKRLAAQPASSLGLGLAGSLLISVWSASSATKSIIDGLNIVYDERERRSFVRLNSVALAFTAGGLLLCVALLAVAVFIGLDPALAGSAKFVLPVLGSASLWAAILALYRWGPSRQQAKWRWLMTGSFLALVLMAISTLGFGWYAKNFAGYDAYGSIGSVIGFMTWVWISLIGLLLGAEVNAEIEHQTTRDSTEGQEKPIGARGATMADTVGSRFDQSLSGPKGAPPTGQTADAPLLLPATAVLAACGIAVALIIARA